MIISLQCIWPLVMWCVPRYRVVLELVGIKETEETLWLCRWVEPSPFFPPSLDGSESQRFENHCTIAIWRWRPLARTYFHSFPFQLSHHQILDLDHTRPMNHMVDRLTPTHHTAGKDASRHVGIGNSCFTGSPVPRQPQHMMKTTSLFIDGHLKAPRK